VDDLRKIDNFGDVKANSFVSQWKSRRGEIETILKYISITITKNKSDKLVGKTFCFTGSFSKPRDEYQKMVVENGGKASSSVSRGVILCWDGSMAGSKLEKAQKGGNQIISEDEFIKLLE
jgi:DNA ligase (NAD+)